MHPILEILGNILSIIFKEVFGILKILFTGIEQGKEQGNKYSSNFMSSRDKNALFSTFNKGIVVNGKLRLNEEKSLAHTLCIGKSSVGKTSGFIIPNLLKIKGSSFICTDVDSKIFQNTSGFLSQKQNYSFQILNFIEILKSERYNPILHCLTKSDLKKLAQMLIDIAFPNVKGDSLFWNHGAVKIIYLILRILQNQEEKYRTLANVKHLIEKFHLLENWITENADDQTFSDYTSLATSEERVLSSFLVTALVALEKFSDEKMNFITSKNTISFRDIVENQRQGLYILIPEKDIEFFGGILSLFYSQFFDYIQTNRPRNITYAFIDEASQITLPNAGRLFSTMRRYNLSLNPVIQSISQLKSKYGLDETDTLLEGSLATKIIYPGMSLSLAKDLSLSFGSITIKDENGNFSERPLVTPSELIQLSDDHILVLHLNKPPLIVKSTKYFKDYTMKKRSKIPPVILETNVYSEPELIPLQNPRNYEE